MAIEVSVVVPVFNEEGSIHQLYSEIKSEMDAINTVYEIIFVNDGSRDNSLEVLKAVAQQDTVIKIVSFASNSGQTAALVCGIDHAQGQIIVLIDGDLQNDPKDIVLLVQKIREGYDVASGWRKNRKDSFFTKCLPSFFANKLVSSLSGVHLHDFGCTLKAYRASILKDIKLYGEMHRFIPIYASWQGAKICEVSVNHRRRLHGKSNYGMMRTMKVLLDLVTIKFLNNYKTKPNYVFGGSGLLCFIFSSICIFALLYNKLFFGKSMIQSPLLLLGAMLVIIGIQFILMGLLAELQIRTYFESLNKQIYIIKEKINF